MSDTYQLLILGNGFDLHCGLRTSYKDFFESEIIDTIAYPFGLNQMKVGCSGFWEKLLLQYYKLYGNVDYRWCDIEKIIHNTLFAIYCQGICNKALSQFKAQYDPMEDMYKQNNIETHLLNECTTIFYNILQTTNIQTEEYCLKLFTIHILQELNNFEKRFCGYIKKLIVNPNNKEQKNTEYVYNAINLFSVIIGNNKLDYQYTKFSIESIKNNEAFKNFLSEINNVNILTFNYTALFDILEIESPCKYTNVHGKLCNLTCNKDCRDSNIIFGVDDNFVQTHSDIPELRLFSKTYRKMISDTNPTSILPSKEGSNIEIKFYGHSLSNADYSYFQSIFDYYDIYSNTKVSLIFYYSKGYEQNDTIYDLINAYGKTLTNKDQGKNLTHKLLLENRLKIVEID